MERDFLGMKDDNRNGSQDDASLNMALQWPFANKASAVHHFMSYKAAQEERQKKCVVSPGVQSKLKVDAFDASGKTFSTQLQQTCFGLGRKTVHQFPVHAYNHSQRPDNWGASGHHSSGPKAFPVVSHPAVPIAMSSPFYKLHGSQAAPNKVATSLKQHPSGGVTTHTQFGGSVTGGPASLSSKTTPMTTQLTIFYAGSVNVFDDVSLEEAQEIMLLASKRSNAPPRSSQQAQEIMLLASKGSNAPPRSSQQAQEIMLLVSKGSNSPPRSSRPDAVVVQAAIPVPTEVAPVNGLNTKKIMNADPIRVASPCSALSSPKSVSSHNGAKPLSSSSTSDTAAGAKPVSPLAKTNREEPSRASTEALGTTSTASAMPRAIPQARKASLARFLEKRKARVISVAPYSFSKTITETCNTLENGQVPSISMLADVNLSSRRENFWCIGDARSNIASGESLSTKLEM